MIRPGPPLHPPPDIPPVDVDGYRPATSIVHKDPVRGTVWHGPGMGCETCDALRDEDP
jgi:hypothetical protein